VQFTRTTTRHRSRAALALGAVLVAAATGLLSPTSAVAAPGNSPDATGSLAETAQQLTVIDAQIDEAELIVAAQQAEATAAAERAAAAQAALTAYEPQLRAIAQSGYTGKSQSRLAAFLTSESATELVQQMTTLDMIARHTNTIVAEVAAAQAAADQAQADAGRAAAEAQAALDELQSQKVEVEQIVAGYQADLARLSATEQAAVTTAVAGPTLAPPSVEDLSLVPGSAAAVAIETALAQLGDAYVWGASGPDGFDCSGLTSYAYAAAGVTLPRSSRAQAQMGREVSRSELQPGDLVFFYDPISHVGLYIGNGKMVHARTFGQPVAVTTVDQNGYRFARRLTG
jgi:cell wall-associated NlpC family hydrolase